MLGRMARTVNPVREKQRRAELTKAAYLALYQHGYAHVTLSDIAKAAGVSKGTLVYYFGSKEKLFEAVLRRFVRTITLSTRRALRKAGSVDDKLVVFVENQFYGLSNTRRFYTVYLDFLSASTKDDRLRAVTRAFFEESRSLDLELARLVEGDAETRAWQLRALVDGLSIRFLYDKDANIDVYRRTCLAGIRAVLNLGKE
ncbi:TetR family transcriptional regulator [Deinococcus yavapaiensis KR-236]|uniref:TetR family transcriptional regulator n=2 Tax=Deinococcus TaxID=1298 RepID=A0A318S7D0_9DEIO|nr:TetR family transcriptional regulator [Deinococcus yavapaiensis KR-236]